MDMLAPLIEAALELAALEDERAAWDDPERGDIDWDFTPEPMALAEEWVEW